MLRQSSRANRECQGDVDNDAYKGVHCASLLCVEVSPFLCRSGQQMSGQIDGITLLGEGSEFEILTFPCKADLEDKNTGLRLLFPDK